MISWFEIPAYHFEKTVEFYARVFNLKTEHRMFDSVPYCILTDEKDKKGITGAIVKVKDKEHPYRAPVLFFKVIDMTETLRRIKLLGGEVLREKTIIRDELENGKTIIPKTLIDNSIGYYGLFRDPDGNKMALHSNS